MEGNRIVVPRFRIAIETYYLIFYIIILVQGLERWWMSILLQQKLSNRFGRENRKKSDQGTQSTKF